MIVETGGPPLPRPIKPSINPQPTSASESTCPHCKQHMHTIEVLPQMKLQPDGSYHAGAEDIIYVCGLCYHGHVLCNGQRIPIADSE